MYSFNSFTLVVLALMFKEQVTGSACMNNTHTCVADSQRCVEQNSTAGFGCECILVDQQLDTSGNCTDVPERQKLYFSMPLDIFDTDPEVVENTLFDSNFSTLVEQMLGIPSLPFYKGLKFLNARLDPLNRQYPRMQYSLLFTEDVNDVILLSTARAVLEVESRGTLFVNNLTVRVAGLTGIFRSQQDLDGSEDAVDWCAYPSLHSCPDFTVCRDGGLRYTCPCDQGYFPDVDNRCTDTVIHGQSPFETDGSRELTLICDAINRTDVTQYTWRGTECVRTQDASCVIRPQPPWDDGTNVTCDVTRSNGNVTSAKFSIDLNYPPQSAPVIEGNPIRSEGDKLRMTCTVDGGKPLVTSVRFSCPGHPDVIDDVIGPNSVTSVLSFTLASSDDGLMCSCSAEWQTSTLYPWSRFRILTVESEESSAAGDLTSPAHPSIYAILAVAIVSLVLVVVLVIILFKLYFRKLAKDKRQLYESRLQPPPRPWNTRMVDDVTTSGMTNGEGQYLSVWDNYDSPQSNGSTQYDNREQSWSHLPLAPDPPRRGPVYLVRGRYSDLQSLSKGHNLPPLTETTNQRQT